MTDRRELILERLVAIGRTLPGLALVDRNRVAVSDLSLPALVVHDGAETAAEDDPPLRPTRTPRRVVMTPQVALLARAADGPVGSALNALRAALVAAVEGDAELLALTRLGEGSARYQGGGLALDEGVGELSVDFAVAYILDPSEL